MSGHAAVPEAVEPPAGKPAAPERIFTWANRVTFTRIALIPVFVWAVFETPEDGRFRWLATGLFVLMALGDLLDGFLARRLGERTALGSFLDPAADKLLMATSAILLATNLWPGPRLPLFAAIAIVSRDVFIVLGYAILFLLRAEFQISPSALGKVSTFVQMSTILCVLIGAHETVILGAAWATLAFTIASGVGYFRIGRKRLG
ncbi:MAG: CDP-alcohol phosphatidyltransferase family protein [Planctomycetota bacterium]